MEAAAGQGLQAGDQNAQVNNFSGDQLRLDSHGGGAYVAAGHLIVHNYPAAEPEQEASGQMSTTQLPPHQELPPLPAGSQGLETSG